MLNTLSFRVDDLKAYVVRFFTALNVPEIDAQIAADVLVSADLRGVNSHGVIRLHTYYGSRLRKKLIVNFFCNPRNSRAITIRIFG